METETVVPEGIGDRLNVAVAMLSGLSNKVMRAEFGTADIDGLMVKMRTVQRLCDGAVAALGTAADAIAAQGQGPILEDVLGTGETVTQADVTADVGRVRVMSAFPEVAAAIRNGTALPGNIHCLAHALRRLNPTERAAFLGYDAALAERVSHLKAGAFRKFVQRLLNRIRSDLGVTPPDRERAAATASVSPRRDRTGYLLRGDYETERGTAIYNAIRNERRELARRLGTTHGLNPDQLTTQALHDLIVRGSGVNPDTHASRPTVTLNVLTDRDTLTTGQHEDTIAETFDGQQLSPEIISRLCCTSVLRRLDTAADSNIHAARSSRTATPEQRAALRALYPVCPISGAVWSHIEVHHILENEHGGRTQLNNLIPISTHWHHLVHEGGWTLTMDPDRTLHLSRPDGTHHKTCPPPTPVNQPLAA